MTDDTPPPPHPDDALLAGVAWTLGAGLPGYPRRIAAPVARR